MLSAVETGHDRWVRVAVVLEHVFDANSHHLFPGRLHFGTILRVALLGRRKETVQSEIVKMRPNLETARTVTNG